MKAMRLLLWMLVLFGCAAHGGVHASSGESSKSGNVAILRHITKGKPSKKSPYRQAYVAQRQEKKHNHNIVMEARKADLKEAIRGPKAHKMDMPENRDAQQHTLLCADRLQPIRKQLAALRMQPPSRRKPYDDLAQSPMYFIIGAERAANNVIRRVLEPERNVTQFDWSGCFMAEHLYPKDFPAAVAANLTNAYVQRQTQGAVLGGAFCAHYLYMPCVAVLIKEFFPYARIVAVYREPTCRAISAFLARRAAVLGLGNIINVTDAETHMLLKRCYAEHSLSHIVNFEMRYFHRGRDHGPATPAWDVFRGGFAVKKGSGYEGNGICWERPELSLLWPALYSETYPLWRELFGSKFLALSYDEFLADPQGATAKAVTHIHPNLAHLVAGHVRPVGTVHPASSLVTHETVAKLREFYNRSMALFVAQSGLPSFTETCTS